MKTCELCGHPATGWIPVAMYDTWEQWPACADCIATSIAEHRAMVAAVMRFEVKS